jgi:hypothetical protein
MRAVIALVALALLVVAFVATAPATLLDRRLASDTDGRLRLAQATGTVWSGSGRIADADGRWQVPLAWRIDPVAMLRGALSVTLIPGDERTARGTIVATPGAVQASGVHLVLPAAAMEIVFAQPPVPRLAGQVSVDVPSLHTDGVRSDGGVDLRWTAARIDLAGLALDLGTLDAHARPSGTTWSVPFASHGGDLGVTGEFRADGPALSLSARLTPAAGLAPALAVMLQTLGAPGQDGSVEVTWQGRR